MQLAQGINGRSGLRIGVLGGSFDPPHAGHVHLSQQALIRFGLTHVLWLVSPGNPLKADAPASVARRMAAAQRLITHPRIVVSDFESRIGTRYTAQTLAALRAQFPAQRFTWLMGADNLAQLHRWQDWDDIMMQGPVGVVARPGARMQALYSPAARKYRAARVPGRASQALGAMDGPAWCFLNIPMRPDSSTALRAQGVWAR